MSIDRTMPAPRLSADARPATRGRERYVPARAVGSYVPKLTRKAFEKYGFSAATLLTDWAVIVGEEIAGFTAPERLKWPRDVGRTRGCRGRRRRPPRRHAGLRVDPARALDVEYKRRQILERINGYFGYRAIAELRLLQAPARRRPRHAAPEPPAAVAMPCEAPELAIDRRRAAAGGAAPPQVGPHAARAR